MSSELEQRSFGRTGEKVSVIGLGGASDEASPSQLTPKDTIGAAFTDERLIKLAETTGISIAAMTVRFLIANRELSTILVGASTPGELEESVAAAQAGPLPSDIHQTLEDLYPASLNT